MVAVTGGGTELLVERFALYESDNGEKFGAGAGKSDGAAVMEAELLGRLSEQRRKERVAQVF